MYKSMQMKFDSIHTFTPWRDKIFLFQIVTSPYHFSKFYDLKSQLFNPNLDPPPNHAVIWDED